MPRSRGEDYLHFTGREEWRAWLEEHHRKPRTVWLLFDKKQTGRACLSYEAAVEEALCFGWIDSLVKKIDETRYARKFTPKACEFFEQVAPSYRRRFIGWVAIAKKPETRQKRLKEAALLARGEKLGLSDPLYPRSRKTNPSRFGYDPSYTTAVKTAISLPDDVFEAAEDLAQELGVSRSHLYALALAEFVAHHQNDDVTERLNAVYGEQDAALDSVLADLQARSLFTDEW